MDFYAWCVFIDIVIAGHRDWPRNGWQAAVREIEKYIDWDLYWELHDTFDADS